MTTLTALILLAGASARVFTTLQDVNDTAVLAGFVTSVVVNLTLLAQITMYWGATKRFLLGATGDAKKKA